jgi:hypothetical protein
MARVMPMDVALAGAGGGRRRGIPGLAGQSADEPELDIIGALGGAMEGLLPTPPPGGFSREEYDPSYTPAAPAMPDKAAAREAQATHAATAAAMARTDPAATTAQGAAQLYRGTGDTKTRTVETGGVTTGAPGGSLRLSVPGRGMVDYDPTDPTIREAFAQQRGGRDDFMAHRTRAREERRPAMDRSDPTMRVGPPGATGRPSFTESAVPEASQVRNWNEFLMGREAEQQQYETGLAESRAREVESTMRAEEPFYTQELAAKGKLAEAAIKAESEGTARVNIMRIVEGAAQQLNAMRQQPRFMALPPEQQRQLEDQIWDQARLTLSALTRTNLYPRPDPYAALLGLTGAPAVPAEEKQ